MRWLVCQFLIVVGCIAQQVAFDLYDEGVNLEESLITRYYKKANDSLLWGPYRSALYFGIRPRYPKSLLSGLMWFSVNDYQSIGSMRHFYEQSDNMGRANWVAYDPRIGGRQIIEDNDCHVTITIDFVKSTDGLSWGTKVKAEPHAGYEETKISFVWYSGLEGEKQSDNGVDETEIERTGYFKLSNQKNILGYEDNLQFAGISEELGAFELEINDGPKKNRHPSGSEVDADLGLDPSLAHHYSLRVPDDNTWKARDIFITMLQESVKDLETNIGTIGQLAPENLFIIRDLHNFEGNLHFVQKVYQGSCEFDVIYTNALTPTPERITFQNIDKRIKANAERFDANFAEHFQLQKPFQSEKYMGFAKEILSGLLGGLSYMYGNHLVDRETVFDEDTFESHELKGSFEGPHELFTLVPSRPFFPRGFYWDEGFHLMPLIGYDSDLVLDIIKSWFNLIDDEGWIAREQILGPEARSRVPSQFQVQSPHIVNPPTLTLVLTSLLETISETNKFGDIAEPNNLDTDDKTEEPELGNFLMKNPEVLFNYTREIYPKLKSHLDMFRKTQQGYIEEFDRSIENNEVFRWRGRTKTHCLASGLDDYPRAQPVDVAELNVDLISWIGIMTRSLRLMAEILNQKDDIADLEDIEKNIKNNIEKIHWSDQNNAYCDVSVDDDDEDVFVCHKGYVSLLPFLTRLIPESDVQKLEHVIDMITNPEELWSPFGVRSLSKSDSNYKTGEDYWRSPIWINMNYLILKSIQEYYNTSINLMSSGLRSKFEDAYHDLRLNVVNNVFKQWEKTGFVWEQYNDETGEAKGAKNFLGWTSAVLLMMAMPERIIN
ncbi:CWH41 [Candida oxycetoniae]|uniref:Mannosyl-oligosaccharide glucosidase n=1 Tax=Candida oxycetoniae TaxID=497107 RepID=A0AAI9SYL1_9ASCO|nr:CWH41 [Candida oxycetoniae]KAI3405556.1 CWH41 [Candida oxycetoniae]